MKKKKVHPGGRPEKYLKENADLAYKFCLLGADDSQLAEFFDVEEKTVNNWKRKHPEFLQSIKRGKNIADAEVAHSLYKRAIGYEHEAVKIFHSENDGTTEVPYIEHYPPDTGAAMAWLKNRQKGKWRDKQDVEHGINPDLASLLQSLDGTANTLPAKK